MSPDTKFNTCSIEQELSDDDIDRELRHAAALELVRLSSEALRPACCVPRAVRALTVMLRTSQANSRPPSSPCLPPVTAAQTVQSGIVLCRLHMHCSLGHPAPPDGFADHEFAWPLWKQSQGRLAHLAAAARQSGLNCIAHAVWLTELAAPLLCCDSIMHSRNGPAYGDASRVTRGMTCHAGFLQLQRQGK